MLLLVCLIQGKAGLAGGLTKCENIYIRIVKFLVVFGKLAKTAFEHTMKKFILQVRKLLLPLG